MATMLASRWLNQRPILERTRYVARVLARHGLGAIMRETGLRRFAPATWRIRNGTELTQAERLRAALGELGATFTKLGQMLSTRADILPPDYVAELAKLQDAAPPIPGDLVVAEVERELSAPIRERFESFEITPLASASIGQVHAATLIDGSRVVVKVQRPDVADQVERDLEIMARLVGWVGRHTALGADYDFRSLLDEFIHTIHGELDYIHEGHNAERFRRGFSDDPGVHIPRVHWSHTTRRVLTLDRVDGIKISDLAGLDRAGIPRRAVAENAVRSFLRQIMEFGFFQADPHPGNFFVQPDASIAMVDFGMVGRLNEAVQMRLLRAGLAAMHMDAESLADELYSLGVAGRRADRRSFEKDLDHFVARYGSQTITELSASAVTRELTELVFRHHLQLPSELALLIRVIAMSEGVGLRLDPDFRYLEYASPILKEHWRSRVSLKARALKLGRSVVEATELASELPRRTDRLLARLERDEIQLNVRHERLEQVTREFQGMTNRLSLAMILAASVIALGVALGAHGGMEVHGYVRWMFALGFVFSLAFGIWVLIGIWRSGRR